MFVSPFLVMLWVREWFQLHHTFWLVIFFPGVGGFSCWEQSNNTKIGTFDWKLNLIESGKILTFHIQNHVGPYVWLQPFSGSSTWCMREARQLQIGYQQSYHLYEHSILPQLHHHHFIRKILVGGMKNLILERLNFFALPFIVWEVGF